MVDGDAPAALGARLARCGHFAALVSRVRAGELSAHDAASPYAPDSPHHRLAVAWIVEHVAFGPAGDARPDGPATALATLNIGQRAVWAEAPLDAGDARRWLGDDARQTLREGALYVVRRGAGGCLACGARLTSARRDSTRSPVVRRWERVLYCDRCDARADSLKRADREAMRTVLDRVADAMLDSEPPRHGARRQRERDRQSRRRSG